MDKEETENLIKWLNSIPLSRRTRNIARDFSDGVMMAELLKYYYPRYVDLHNYSPAFKSSSKYENWSTLNRKVLSNLNLQISDNMIKEIVSGTKYSILILLTRIHLKVAGKEGGHVNGCGGDCRQKTSIPLRTLCIEKKKSKEMDCWALLKKKNQELSEKEELIRTLTHTVSNLEIELKLKNENIKDLSSELGVLNAQCNFTLF
jgi:hypothetical protein